MYTSRLEYLWNMYNMFIECVWNMYGMCMEVARNMYGTCMEYARNMYGISIDICLRCMEHVWNMQGICIEYVWNGRQMTSCHLPVSGATLFNFLQDSGGICSDCIARGQTWVNYCVL